MTPIHPYRPSGRRGVLRWLLGCGFLVLIACAVAFVFIKNQKPSDEPGAQRPESTTTVTEPELTTTGPDPTTTTTTARIVCIDAGHGGKDPGTIYENRYEKNDNLRLALAVEKHLKDAGVTVVMTRSDDSYPTLSKRCAIANSSGARYMVSLHRNFAEGAKGTEIWVSSNRPAADKKLAQTILDALREVGISEDRGVNYGTAGSTRSDYYINKNTDMPSCIIELGFINSAVDNQLFDANLDAYARAIAEAIISLLK